MVPSLPYHQPESPVTFQNHDVQTLNITSALPDGTVQATHPDGITIAPGDCITFQSFDGTGAIGFIRTWDVTPDGYPVHVRPDVHYRVADVSDDGATIVLRHDPRVTVEYLGEDDGYPD